MTRKTKKPAARRKSGPPRSSPAALEAMAARQGVQPIDDPDKLFADFWPEDETADQFMQAVRQWRREGAGRSQP